MKVGTAKVKVHIRKRDYTLQGYGRMDHTASAVENDLNARAFVFSDGKITIALLNLECAFISHHLKKSVIERLIAANPGCEINDGNLLLTANSTHSAPGGYSHYPYFNITTMGFRKDVFEMYAEASFKALNEALKNKVEVSCFLNASYFSEDEDVGFNRSLEAYNQNSDMEAQDEEHTHRAINRLVRQIVMRKSSGGLVGLINWFGVQGTSIPAGSGKIHPDNKGFASSLLENDQSENTGFVAGFCVEAAGDVSPNHHGNVKRWPRGKYEDPFKSAYFNGFLQFEKARNMLEDENLQIALGSELDFVQQYVDFSQVITDKAYTADNREHQSAEAIVGLEALIGDEIDHSGLDSFSGMMLRQFIKLRMFLVNLPLINSRIKRAKFKRLKEAHGNKLHLIELQDKSILGYKNISRIPLPYMPSDVTSEMKKQFRNGGLREHTWAPIILPVQILRLGALAILGVPGEITTAAGIRLRQSVQRILEPSGILDVVITSLSNEYGGYFCTYEEYSEQKFEGASTLFGCWSLAALQTEFGKIANEMLKPPHSRRISTSPRPPEFSDTELNLRSSGHVS